MAVDADGAVVCEIHGGQLFWSCIVCWSSSERLMAAPTKTSVAVGSFAGGGCEFARRVILRTAQLRISRAELIDWSGWSCLPFSQCVYIQGFVPYINWFYRAGC